MADTQDHLRSGLNRMALVHSIRAAVAAAASYSVARLLQMPESYWAAVTTMIVMQSTLGATWEISAKRFAGTALGCALGALLARSFGANVFAFGIAILGLGLICAALHLDQAAYRFASISLTIVMMVARAESAWTAGLHRFVEVSVGIAVGLALAALWREPDPQPRRPVA